LEATIVKYIGIDGCKLGWFFVGLDDSGDFSVGVIRHIDEIKSWLEDATLILIDIPIGLVTEGPTERLCDLAARQMIKPRTSTVFPAPARSSLSESSFEAASAENYRRTGRKLSKQSWAISPKIKEVDDFMRSVRPGRKVREMHPEVAFCGLNGGSPILTSKKKSDGFGERFELLESIFPKVAGVVQAARDDTPRKMDLQNDDILDALVGAITASRDPDLHTLPPSPTLDDEGLPMEMVFAKRSGDT
jgi:predicted RNase H-like nuclease